MPLETDFGDYVDAVVAAINTLIPDLGSCAPHPGRFDLETVREFAIKPPAVRVAVLGWSTVTLDPAGFRDVTLLMAAYISTIDQPGLKRDRAALNIGNTLAAFLPDQRFTDCTFGAKDLKGQNLFNGNVNAQGVHIWALTWSQDIRIGVTWWDEHSEPAPSETYVGIDPEIGADHESDYLLINPPS